MINVKMSIDLYRAHGVISGAAWFATLNVACNKALGTPTIAAFGDSPAFAPEVSIERDIFPLVWLRGIAVDFGDNVVPEPKGLQSSIHWSATAKYAQ